MYILELTQHSYVSTNRFTAGQMDGQLDGWREAPRDDTTHSDIICILPNLSKTDLPDK